MKIEKTVCWKILGKILPFIIISVLFSAVSGQELRKEAPPLKERLFYGGDFFIGANSSISFSNIEISPLIGIWVLPKLAVAAGPIYKYQKDFTGKTSIFGGRAYAEYTVIKDIDKFIPMGINTSFLVHLEDEVLSLDSYHARNIVLSPKRFVINSFLAGVGLSQQVGRRSFVNFMVLWALNEAALEIHTNPMIRIGYIF